MTLNYSWHFFNADEQLCSTFKNSEDPRKSQMSTLLIHKLAESLRTHTILSAKEIEFISNSKKLDDDKSEHSLHFTNNVSDDIKHQTSTSPGCQPLATASIHHETVIQHSRSKPSQIVLIYYDQFAYPCAYMILSNDWWHVPAKFSVVPKLLQDQSEIVLL